MVDSAILELAELARRDFTVNAIYRDPPTDEQIAAKCPAKCMSVDPHFETGH